jgi:hypothetical protein
VPPAVPLPTPCYGTPPTSGFAIIRRRKMLASGGHFMRPTEELGGCSPKRDPTVSPSHGAIATWPGERRHVPRRLLSEHVNAEYIKAAEQGTAIALLAIRPKDAMADGCIFSMRRCEQGAFKLIRGDFDAVWQVPEALGRGFSRRRRFNRPCQDAQLMDSCFEDLFDRALVGWELQPQPGRNESCWNTHA